MEPERIALEPSLDGANDECLSSRETQRTAVDGWTNADGSLVRGGILSLNLLSG